MTAKWRICAALPSTTETDRGLSDMTVPSSPDSSESTIGQILSEAYGPAVSSPTPTAPNSPRRIMGMKPPILAVISVLLIAAIGVGVWLIVRPSYFKMTGTITLTNDRNSYSFNECHGTGGYSDIREGAPVTVYSSKGEIVGLGSLASSVPFEEFDECLLSFTIEKVKAGEGPYQYEVSHRGRLTVTEESARSGLLSTLGS